MEWIEIVVILVFLSPFIISIFYGIYDSIFRVPKVKAWREIEEEQEKLKQKKHQIAREAELAAENIESLKKAAQQEAEFSKEACEIITSIVEKLINEKCDAYPYMAGIRADLLTHHYEMSSDWLENKIRPALKEAARIKELTKETKQIIKEKKIVEYKLAYIETLFPNIADIFDSEFNYDENFTLETDDNTDRVRNFLSHDEYIKLSTAEKNQLALDRYLINRKSKWQIGRDYEMYIGQGFEHKGFSVEYTGIIENIEDMGRDLIAKKEKKTYIVQCKNWSQEKTIHEKHIFQLYGTVVLKKLESPSDEKIRGVFVTTTTLSEKARQIAKHLNIWVYQKVTLKDFPRIKCNINRTTNEKIYHLPFDQQYDTAQIEASRGEFYALTVKEAEEKGFRRAFRHFTNN